MVHFPNDRCLVLSHCAVFIACVYLLRLVIHTPELTFPDGIQYFDILCRVVSSPVENDINAESLAGLK